MVEWPLPQTGRQSASFLGFVNYHRDHIRNYAQTADPLYKILAANGYGKISLEFGHIDTINALKSLVVSAPVLKFPLPDYTFIVDVDASVLQSVGNCYNWLMGENTPFHLPVTL